MMRILPKANSPLFMRAWLHCGGPAFGLGRGGTPIQAHGERLLSVLHLLLQECRLLKLACFLFQRPFSEGCLHCTPECVCALHTWPRREIPRIHEWIWWFKIMITVKMMIMIKNGLILWGWRSQSYLANVCCGALFRGVRRIQINRVCFQIIPLSFRSREFTD
jgi:hypothetical protein